MGPGSFFTGMNNMRDYISGAAARPGQHQHQKPKPRIHIIAHKQNCTKATSTQSWLQAKHFGKTTLSVHKSVSKKESNHTAIHSRQKYK